MRVLTITFCCLLRLTLIKAQSINPENKKIVCEYALKYHPDSTSTTSKQDVFFLISDKQKSIFREKIAFKQDSLAKAYESLPMNEANAATFTEQLMRMPVPAFSFTVYKNYAEKEVYFVDKIDKVSYYYQESSGFLTWQLLPEVRQIAGYACQKATTTFAGRSWEAWFTREIPVADGPYKFYGLPGLIVEIKDKQNYYTFSLQKVTQGVAFVSLSPRVESLRKTTKQVLTQAKKDYASSAVSRMTARGVSVPESRIQAYNTRLKSQNNPLEIK